MSITFLAIAQSPSSEQRDTPGHHSLFVRLADRGLVMPNGDMAHFWDNFCCRHVPLMNASKDQSRRSTDKIDAIVQAEGAEFCINHEWD